ncbi:MAG: yojE [Firmicutes bacterium]|nr:yojE [Bacillota bacterium]
MKNDKTRYGLLCGISSYMMWGVLPVFWKLVQDVPAYEILAHRILWSFIVMSMLVVLSGGLSKLADILRDRRSMAYIAACSVLITFNWFLFIWCVNNGHIVESSLGYYINPLMSVFLGTVVLKEKLDASQKVAIAIAATGVIAMVVFYGSFPWIPLALASSFGVYGLLKKKVALDSMAGLTIETLITAPFALAFLAHLNTNGGGAFGSTAVTTVILMLSGAVTAMPLLLFAEGAKNVRLSTMGFLQYVSPTISLVIGIFLYKESVTQVNMIGFCFIWAALAVYSYSLLRPVRTKA